MINPAALRLSAFYGAVFAFVGAYMPFWPVWLQSRGLSPAEIGLALSAGMWVRIFAGPIVTDRVERFGRRRGLVALASLALLIFAGFGLARSFWPILALAAGFSLFWAAITPLGEALTLGHVYASKLDYGRIRLWGSLAFIVTATLGGRILGAWGVDGVFALLLACLALTILAASALPADERPAARSKGSAAGLLRRPAFLLLLAASAMIQASHAMIYGFGALEWRRLGIGDDAIGWLWAEGVIAEVLLFAVSNAAVARFGVVGLLLLASAAGALRWTAMALEPGFGMLLLLQPLHAFTFGATYLAAMHFLARAAPPDRLGAAQAMHAAFGVGLAMAAATSLSGLAYEAFGSAAFLAMAAMAALGGLAALGLARAWDGGHLAL
jgi:PPP family 3-phenylpropionic acid transporter